MFHCFSTSLNKNPFKRRSEMVDKANMGMKKSIAIALFALLSGVVRAEDTQTVPEPTQKPDVSFRRFRSRNIYNFLKLDTRSGMVWQVQWGTEKGYQWVTPINLVPLADGKKIG